MSSIEVKDLILSKPTSGNQPDSRITILKGINAKFEQGKLNAIMGANGCGKTTFLDILYGYCESSTQTSGTILYNGEPRNIKEWFEKVSYSEQQSYEITRETAREVIQFAIDLKNAKENLNSQITEFGEIFEELNIADLLDKSIEVLSGGERQRVLIAAELVLSREIIILDEPTSDLDSHLALNLILFLKKMAHEKNITVILTIHQPSDQIFQCFDNLLFMMDGRAIYDGEAEKLESYLASKNIIRPDNWLISEFIFEAFYSQSCFEEIQALDSVVDALRQDITLNSDLVLSTAKISNKTPERYENKDFNIKEAYCIFKRHLKKCFRRKAFIFNLIYSFSIYFILFFIMQKIVGYNFKPQLDKALDSVIPQELNLPPLLKGLLEGFRKHSLALFSLSFTVILTFNFYESIDQAFNVITPQVLKEVQKNFYSALTLHMAAVFTDITFGFFIFVIILLNSFAFGIVTFVNIHIWIIIFIHILSGIFLVRLALTFFNSSSIWIILFSMLRSYTYLLYPAIHLLGLGLKFISISTDMFLEKGKITAILVYVMPVLRILVALLTFYYPASFLMNFYFMKFFADRLNFTYESLPEGTDFIDLSFFKISNQEISFIENLELSSEAATSSQNLSLLKFLEQLLSGVSKINIKINSSIEKNFLIDLVYSPALYSFFNCPLPKWIFLIGMLLSFVFLSYRARRLYPKRYDPFISLKI